MENSSELIEQLNSQFPETMAIGLKNEMNYEDLRIALAQYLAILLKENKTLLYAQLYRIDVAEKDVKIALENKNSEYLLAEFILQKLNEKLYWRNKYKKAFDIYNNIDFISNKICKFTAEEYKKQNYLNFFDINDVILLKNLKVGLVRSNDGLSKIQI